MIFHSSIRSHTNNTCCSSMLGHNLTEKATTWLGVIMLTFWITMKWIYWLNLDHNKTIFAHETDAWWPKQSMKMTWEPVMLHLSWLWGEICKNLSWWWERFCQIYSSKYMYYPGINVRGSHWWRFTNIDSDNGLVPSGNNKPLPEPVLTKISDVIRCH